MSVELTPAARKLWQLLTERPSHYTLGELRADLHASKTSLKRSVMELEEAGIIRTWEEENQQRRADGAAEDMADGWLEQRNADGRHPIDMPGFRVEYDPHEEMMRRHTEQGE